MSSLFANMAQANFNAATLSTFGEEATYTQDGTDTTFRATVQSRPEGLSMDETWETLARQVEVYAAAADVPTDCNIRIDTITVRGETYTVLEREKSVGAVYRYLCERSELEQISHRGRRF